MLEAAATVERQVLRRFRALEQTLVPELSMERLLRLEATARFNPAGIRVPCSLAPSSSSMEIDPTKRGVFEGCERIETTSPAAESMTASSVQSSGLGSPHGANRMRIRAGSASTGSKSNFPYSVVEKGEGKGPLISPWRLSVLADKIQS